VALQVLKSVSITVMDLEEKGIKTEGYKTILIIVIIKLLVIYMPVNSYKAIIIIIIILKFFEY
jgi:hypothetical protein